jgi:MOSC domain-containing protein YiiM
VSIETRRLTCDVCGFDGARWSDDDLERTLAHVDDLIGHAIAGAPDEASLAAFSHAVADDPVVATHAVMHRLDELAAIRRSNDPFEPMVGSVASIQASSGGVPKRAVAEAIVGPGGIDGDGQSNRRHHGRPWQALCLYSTERLDALVAEGHPIGPGAAGENLTISGVDWSRMRGGLTIEIGDVRLRTSGPAAPCRTIGECFADRHWNRIDHVEQPGWSRWYASVLGGGTIRPGDAVIVTA